MHKWSDAVLHACIHVCVLACVGSCTDYGARDAQHLALAHACMLPFRPNYRKVEIPSIVTRRQTRVLLGHTPKASETKPDPRTSLTPPVFWTLEQCQHEHESDPTLSTAVKRVDLIHFAVWFNPSFKKLFCKLCECKWMYAYWCYGVKLRNDLCEA